ncbi:MAG: transglutaminase-like domain-containing protein, partial [Myxococcota bacterium]
MSTLVAVADGSLEDAAIALAASEQPDVDPQAIRASLDALSAPIRIPEGASTIEGLARLTLELFQRQGFRGDEEEYDAPHNSFVDRVLERRRGLPIALSVITVAVGDRVGVPLDPVGFPGHFLVAPRHAEDRFFVDPFHQGAIVNATQLRAQLTRQMGLVDEATFRSA